MEPTTNNPNLIQIPEVPTDLINKEIFYLCRWILEQEKKLLEKIPGPRSRSTVTLTIRIPRPQNWLQKTEKKKFLASVLFDDLQSDFVVIGSGIFLHTGSPLGRNLAVIFNT